MSTTPQPSPDDQAFWDIVDQVYDDWEFIHTITDIALTPEEMTRRRQEIEARVRERRGDTG